MKKNPNGHEAQFNKLLYPFLLMLASKRDQISQDEWLRLVERTKNSIIWNPDQYLGNQLPSKDLIKIIVTDIFDDFLGEHQ
jgi:hypothetical protein